MDIREWIFDVVRRFLHLSTGEIGVAVLDNIPSKGIAEEGGTVVGCKTVKKNRSLRRMLRHLQAVGRWFGMGKMRREERRTASKTPVDILLMACNLLSPFKPPSHLGKLVLAVCCVICVLGKVDVKPLRVLGVEIVGSTKPFDEVDIVSHEVQLRNAPAVPDVEVFEDPFVLMKAIEGFLQQDECLSGVNRVLSEVKEVKNCSNRADEAHRRHATRKRHVSNKTEEDSGNVAVLASGELRERRDAFGEHADVMVRRKTSTARINLGGTVCR